MDKIREIGNTLGQVKKDTEYAIQRYRSKSHVVERTRDTLSGDENFIMEFEVLEFPALFELSLFFIPGGNNLCDPQSGCFAGRCDFFSGTTDTVLTTTYAFIPGAIYVYKNDVAVSFTESGASQITLTSAPSVTDRITVCYIYEITGCFQNTYQNCIFDDFDDRTTAAPDALSNDIDDHGDLGTASSGLATWDWNIDSINGNGWNQWDQTVQVTNGAAIFGSKLTSSVFELTHQVNLPAGAVSNAWRDGLYIEARVKFTVPIIGAGRQGFQIHLGNQFGTGRTVSMYAILENEDGIPFPGENSSYPAVEPFMDTWYTFKGEIVPYTESVDGTVLVRWKMWPENSGEPGWLEEISEFVSMWLGQGVDPAPLENYMDMQYVTTSTGGTTDTNIHYMYVDYIDVQWPNKICP